MQAVTEPKRLQDPSLYVHINLLGGRYPRLYLGSFAETEGEKLKEEQWKQKRFFGTMEMYERSTCRKKGKKSSLVDVRGSAMVWVPPGLVLEWNSCPL